VVVISIYYRTLEMAYLCDKSILELTTHTENDIDGDEIYENLKDFRNQLNSMSALVHDCAVNLCISDLSLVERLQKGDRSTVNAVTTRLVNSRKLIENSGLNVNVKNRLISLIIVYALLFTKQEKLTHNNLNFDNFIHLLNIFCKGFSLNLSYKSGITLSEMQTLKVRYRTLNNNVTVFAFYDTPSFILSLRTPDKIYFDTKHVTRSLKAVKRLDTIVLPFVGNQTLFYSCSFISGHLNNRLTRVYVCNDLEQVNSSLRDMYPEFLNAEPLRNVQTGFWRYTHYKSLETFQRLTKLLHEGDRQLGDFLNSNLTSFQKQRIQKYYDIADKAYLFITVNGIVYFTCTLASRISEFNNVYDDVISRIYKENKGYKYEIAELTLLFEPEYRFKASKEHVIKLFARSSVHSATFRFRSNCMLNDFMQTLSP